MAAMVAAEGSTQSGAAEEASPAEAHCDGRRRRGARRRGRRSGRRRRQREGARARGAGSACRRRAAPPAPGRAPTPGSAARRVGRGRWPRGGPRRRATRTLPPTGRWSGDRVRPTAACADACAVRARRGLRGARRLPGHRSATRPPRGEDRTRATSGRGGPARQPRTGIRSAGGSQGAAAASATGTAAPRSPPKSDQHDRESHGESAAQPSGVRGAPGDASASMSGASVGGRRARSGLSESSSARRSRGGIGGRARDLDPRPLRQPRLERLPRGAAATVRTVAQERLEQRHREAELVRAGVERLAPVLLQRHVPRRPRTERLTGRLRHRAPGGDGEPQSPPRGGGRRDPRAGSPA